MTYLLGTASREDRDRMSRAERKRTATRQRIAAAAAQVVALDPAAVAKLTSRDQLLQYLATQSNDLEEPAIALKPVIADVLTGLRGLPGCRLARMSGSGATCFGLFSSATVARAAGKVLRDKYQHWWVKAGVLGGDRT